MALVPHVPKFDINLLNISQLAGPLVRVSDQFPGKIEGVLEKVREAIEALATLVDHHDLIVPDLSVVVKGVEIKVGMNRLPAAHDAPTVVADKPVAGGILQGGVPGVCVTGHQPYGAGILQGGDNTISTGVRGLSGHRSPSGTCEVQGNEGRKLPQSPMKPADPSARPFRYGSINKCEACDVVLEKMSPSERTDPCENTVDGVHHWVQWVPSRAPFDAAHLVDCNTKRLSASRPYDGSQLSDPNPRKAW